MQAVRKLSSFLRTIFVIFIFIFSLCQSSVNGQVQVYPVSVITQLTPPYSVNLADYAAPGCEQLKVIIVQRDLTQAPYRFYLKMEIELNGRIIIRTSRLYVPPAVTLDPGIPTVISGTELSPVSLILRIWISWVIPVMLTCARSFCLKALML